MAMVALLSNPRSTGNKSLLPQVRSFCARHEDIFHYEVEDVAQIGAALRSIARVKPKVLVINGGDGTVQAALTELFHGEHFGGDPPPVAVLPNGKTNLIAHDLGADGDPIDALERVLELARTDMAPQYRPARTYLDSPMANRWGPVLGMFLGGAGLAIRCFIVATDSTRSGFPLAGPWLSLDDGAARHHDPTSGAFFADTGLCRSPFRCSRAASCRALRLPDGDDTAASPVGSTMPGSQQRSGRCIAGIERRVPALLRALIASLRGRLGAPSRWCSFASRR